MELRKVCLRSAAVITAGVAVPLGIFRLSGSAERLRRFAESSGRLTVADRSSGTEKAAGAEVSAEKEKAYPQSVGASSLELSLTLAPSEDEPEFSSSEIPSPLPAEDMWDELPYPSPLDDRDGVIERFNFGYYTDDGYFDLPSGGQVRNCTTLTEEYLLEQAAEGLPFDTDISGGEPLVLIYHTHTTESFELTERDWYDRDFTGKTTDPDKNIISVGNCICKELDAAGIPYIHDTLVHDYPSYDSAYGSSREAVQEILEEYPSIKVCLDIHRDGIERADGTRVAPVAEINGRSAAQIMIISCADDGSGNIPRYMENFRFACALQSQVESDWAGLTRPVLFDTRYYNQDLSTGSLLIEMGSHGNSLSEAQYSGELLGKSLAVLLS
ncbi:MAG: stage II sporulation protein P [Ruminococcus sp.]|nr:stage II sporulation protein P [Ruminococcus sp.]